MAEPADPQSNNAGDSASYAAYGQLIKMLLPSTGSIVICDSGNELIWCSDGYERPDLRQLLERLRSSDTIASRGSIEPTAAGVPAFVALLRGKHSRPLGSLVIELSENSKQTPSMVLSMLRPVLDTLENRLDLEATRSTSAHGDDDPTLELLLAVDEAGQLDSGALTQLLRHSMLHLDCVLGALLVPDKNLQISCTLDDSVSGAKILDRTQKHLLAWAQLNNRPMVVNRVAGAASVAPYKILSCPIRDVHSRVIGLVALFRAVTAEDFELRDIRILEFMSRKTVAILASQYDGLTGLVNRLIFERRAQSTLDAGGDVHALLYADIDHLEAINAAFGFQAGDEVIQRVADMLRRACGPSGLVCRMGGDRFAAFLPKTSLPSAHEIGKRLLAAMTQLGYVHGVDSVPVSVSVGVMELGRGREQVSHVLAAAELACKRAKQQGGGRIAVADADAAAALGGEQQFAAATLQEAFRANDFRLEAQPIVGLGVRAGEVVGYELLVRMRNSAGALIGPDKFLDAAERYELLPALDRWVLCSAIEALRPYAQSVAGASYCYTLNVSAQSIATRKYAEFALEQIANAGLPPRAFCFELKEAAAVNHVGAAEMLIRDFTNAGCKIALDNFGSGLSSLAHLKRLPVHYLKIDGRFVRRIVDDRIAESIVSGIARAARTLGVSAIAEHVENVATAEKLRELDVDFGQGFQFGRPEPLGSLLSALAAAPAVRVTTHG
jgi:diguanylate cyclase (GGDEF)-like protein